MMNKKYIYIYQTPSSKEKGLIKIGDAFDIDARIKQQLNTAAAISADQLAYELLYKTEAVLNNGTEIRDHDIHKALEAKGYPKHQISEGDGLLKNSTEWFQIDVEQAIHLIEQIKKGKKPEEIDIDRFQDFPMRPEQSNAVEQTRSYFLSQTSGATVEMMWNAKMRFGKTFTAYQLMRRMEFKKTLILTYKPAVEDAWKQDLEHHVDFKEYVFLKQESLSSINEHLGKNKGVVAFASYQDILGTKTDGNEIKDKHLQLFGTEWDLVVIDEFHYGANTKKAKQMIEDSDISQKEKKELEKEFFAEEDDELIEEHVSEEIDTVVHKAIRSKYRLYLSGTPFKAMADDRFPKEAIFNWTYPDEQKAKEKWYKDNPDKDPKLNPYRKLPQIKLYLYKVADDLIEAGKDEGKDEFSLNHFFKAKQKKFLNEPAVRRWLDLITGRLEIETSKVDEIHEGGTKYASQYPYDHDCALAKEIDHALWYFNRVDSAIAMADLIKEHPILQQYHVILVAGKETKSGVDALPPVEKALQEHDKTITITVGKLTTGVSVPKWKAVLFLRDTDSPENYFQTAFRAQTPYENKLTGEIKETCYIFDFSPNRSLKLLTSYSEKLSSDSLLTTSEQKITEFIRYLPVLKVYGNEMYEMDAREVLTFDLSGIDAKGLGMRFVERRNIVVTRETIDAMNANTEVRDRCAAIFEKIKMFKKYSGASDTELKNSDVDLVSLDANNQKIKKLETKTTSNEKEEKERNKELEKVEKEQKSEREKLRELLKTLLSRIPLYMYLTDATEENLEQVLVGDVHDLFRKATGITVDDFRYLKEIGLLQVDSIDGYILKFLELENKNFNEHNRHFVSG
ncbi:MAG: GIY-YIG nuclease family protein [Sulfuricurvum sp.]|nr:GIY-YIG nuclease family protein [Sulfuricurvum sp.]